MTKRHGGAVPMLAPQERLTARPDEIQTKAPLKQAVLQMLRGYEAEAGPRPNRWHWLVCPPLRQPCSGSLDLRGVRWGRLSVVGLLDVSGTDRKGGRWVVRCDCGRFEVRKAKAIRERVEPIAACGRCEYVVRIKRRAVFDRDGYWPSYEELFQ